MKPEDEVKYLRNLLWKLSLPHLINQHSKYKIWLKRTYAEKREDTWGIGDSDFYNDMEKSLEGNNINEPT